MTATHPQARFQSLVAFASPFFTTPRVAWSLATATMTSPRVDSLNDGRERKPGVLSRREIDRIAISNENAIVTEATPRMRKLRKDFATARTEFKELAALGSKGKASLYQKTLMIFKGIGDELAKVRRYYYKKMHGAVQSIADQHAGKTFTRDNKTPPALLLASVPKGKEKKDLSMSTLVKAIDSYARFAPDCKGTAQVTSDHILLVREKDGKTETLELTFRRPGKVDIFRNGQSKFAGSVWNDDALLLAQAFLKGKNIILSREPAKEYVVRRDLQKPNK